MNRRGNKTAVKPIKDESTIHNMAQYLKQRDAETGEGAYCVWLLCVNCGLRVGDALNMRIASLCGQGKRVKENLEFTEGKTGKLRRVPLGNHVRKELQEYINRLDWSAGGVKYQSFLFASKRRQQKHMTYAWMNNRIKEAGAVCGIENACTHIMRKTFAWLWYRNNLSRYGGSVMETARALQEAVLHHTSIKTTLLYIDAVDDFNRETFKGIDYV